MGKAKLSVEEKAAKSRKHKPRVLLTEEVTYQVIGMDKKSGLERILCSVRTADAASGTFELAEKYLSDKMENFFIRKAALMTRNTDGQA